MPFTVEGRRSRGVADVFTLCLFAILIGLCAVAVRSGVGFNSFTLGVVGLATVALLLRANAGGSGHRAELTGTMSFDDDDLEIVQDAERAGLAPKTILLGMLVEDLLAVGCEELAERAKLHSFNIVDQGSGEYLVTLADEDEGDLTIAAERLGGDWTVTK